MLLQVVGADAFMIVVDTVFQRFDGMFANEVTDVVEEGGDHQAFGRSVAYGAGRGLFHVLRHGDCFSHVFVRALVCEQVENEIDDLGAIFLLLTHEANLQPNDVVVILVQTRGRVNEKNADGKFLQQLLRNNLGNSTLMTPLFTVTAFYDSDVRGTRALHRSADG